MKVNIKILLVIVLMGISSTPFAAEIVKKTQSLEGSDINALSIRGEYKQVNVTVDAKAKPQIEFLGSQEAFDHIKITRDSKNNAKLVIQEDRGFPKDAGKSLVLNITVPKLESLAAAGQAQVNVKDPTHGKTMSMSVSGQTTGSYVGQTESFEMNASGQSTYRLSGASQQVTLFTTGDSKIDASNFVAEAATVNSVGNGNVSMYATQSVNANAVGDSHVVVHGNPKTIAQNTVGEGKVTVAQK